MKIVSWNVNGFRAASNKGAINELITRENPDVIFLQEMKCSEQQALEVAYDMYGYKLFHTEGQISGRHSVAYFVREELLDMVKPLDSVSTQEVIPPDPLVDGKREGRLQGVVINDVFFINTYSVNVRPDLCRIEQRAKYDGEISKLIDLWNSFGGHKVVVLGDFNVVSEAIDYHGGVINPNVAGMTDSERASFKVLLRKHNLVDAFREKHPDKKRYSWWSYRGYARESNKGWRLDYTLVSASLLPSVEQAEILTDIYGSDHAPILLELEGVI